MSFDAEKPKKMRMGNGPLGFKSKMWLVTLTRVRIIWIEWPGVKWSRSKKAFGVKK